MPGFVLTPRGAAACPAVRRFEGQVIRSTRSASPPVIAAGFSDSELIMPQLAIVELLEHKSIFSAG